MKNQRGSINWSALTALAALITAAAAVVMCGILAVSMRSDLQRGRFVSSLDTLWRLDADWSSPGMVDARSNAATALLAGRSVREIDQVLDFLDEIALLLQRGAVDEELVWYEFYRPMVNYWFASQKYAAKNQSKSAGWEQLAVVIPRLLEIEAQRHTNGSTEGGPSSTQIRDFLNTEIDAGQCYDDDQEADLRKLPS